MSADMITKPVSDQKTEQAVLPDLGKVSLNFERLFRDSVGDWRIKLLSESFLKAVSDDRIKNVLYAPIAKLAELGMFTVKVDTQQLRTSPGNSEQFISSLIRDLKTGIADLIRSRELPPSFAPIIAVLTKLQGMTSVDGGDPRTKAKIAANIAVAPQTIVDYVKKALDSKAVLVKLSTTSLSAQNATVIEGLKNIADVLLFPNPVPDQLVAELMTRSTDRKSRAKLLGAEQIDLSELARDLYKDKESYIKARLETLPTAEKLANLLSSLVIIESMTPSRNPSGALIVHGIISGVSEFLSDATRLIASIEADLIFDGAEKKKKTKKAS